MTRKPTDDSRSEQGWTEEQIAALVDGSLEDPAVESALRRILEHDPEARAFAERVRRSNVLLREAFEAPVDEPMPERIKSAIYGTAADRIDREAANDVTVPDNVTPLPRRPRAKTWLPVALAASLALVVGFSVAKLTTGPTAPATIASLGEAPGEGALHLALETLASGQTSPEGVQPVLTFRDRDGRSCREFDVQGELPDSLEFGIACRTPAGRWHVEIVVTAPIVEPGAQGYAPASGPGSDALEAMLDALGAGPAVGPDTEAALLESGWRR